jgi:hypothetical protein
MTNISDSDSVRPEFMCPFCGGNEIAELAISVVLHNVSKWNSAGKPEEYEPAEVDWETDFPYALLNQPYRTPPVTFECRRCCEHFETPRRAAQAVSEMPAETDEASSQKHYGCPNCMSDNIVEQGLVPLEYTGSFFTNDKGQPEFERDGADAEVFWDCEQPGKLPCRCLDCSHQFREPTEITPAAYKANLAHTRER